MHDEACVPFAFLHAGYGWRVAGAPVVEGGIAVDPNEPKCVILGLDGSIVF